MGRQGMKGIFYLAASLLAAALLLGLAYSDKVRRSGDGARLVAALPEPIQVSLTLSESNVQVRSAVMLRGIVMKGRGPVAGAPVSFRIARPGGTTNITVTTDDSGVAEWKYKPQHNGTYSVSVTGSWEGSENSAGPLTFTASE